MDGDPVRFENEAVASSFNDPDKLTETAAGLVKYVLDGVPIKPVLTVTLPKHLTEPLTPPVITSHKTSEKKGIVVRFTGNADVVLLVITVPPKTTFADTVAVLRAPVAAIP